jgi:hypothetical protein
MNGLSVPSVTRVIDHAGLSSYEMVKREILERKSKIGQLVHLATKYFDKGTLDRDSLDSYTRGRTEAWIQFRRDTGFEPRIIEEPFITCINGMNVGLTVDREGLMGGRPTIIEIKCTSNIEPWFGIQTAGYALGVPDPEGYPWTPRLLFAKRRRMVVQLFEDGTYKKKDFTDPQDAEVFLSGLHITSWKLANGEKLRKIEELAAA